MKVLERCAWDSTDDLDGSADSYRFVMEPMEGVKNRMAEEEKGLKRDIEDLGKKYHYLETTFVNAQDNLKQILNRGQ